MKRHFSSLGRYSIVEADLDENNVGGAGGHIAPSLILPLILNISHGYMEPTQGIEFKSLSVKLCLSQNRAFSTTQVILNRLITPKYSTTRESAYLEFALSAATLTELERIRAGGDLKLRLEMVLWADELRDLVTERKPDSIFPLAWAYSQPHRLCLDEEITVRRDTWISRVLPQVGYGRVHVLEFPAVPVELTEAFQHAFAALKQAQERHLLGLYDDAVGKCRVALDQFLEKVEEDDGNGGKKMMPRLRKHWADKLGRATYVWLDGAFDAVRYAGNPNHHTPNVHYDQLESQMILAVTCAVVAYAARATGKTGQT